VHHKPQERIRVRHPDDVPADDADDDTIYVFATRRHVEPGLVLTTSPPAARARRTRRRDVPVTVRELQGDERSRIYDEQRAVSGFAD